MKKVLATILAVIYLATSAGTTVTMHYCMGKIYAEDMVKKDKCSKCGMKKANGCCKDEVKVIKVQDTHHSVNHIISFEPGFAVLQTEYNLTKTAFQPLVSTITTHNNSPPNSSGKALCILNSVFRI